MMEWIIGGVQHATVPVQPIAKELSLEEHNFIFQLSHYHFQALVLRLPSQKQNYLFPIHFHFTNTFTFLKQKYQSSPFSSFFVSFLYSYCFKVFKELQITLELYLQSISTETIDIFAIKRECLQSIPFEQRFVKLWKLICDQQKLDFISWHHRLEQVLAAQLQFAQFVKPKIEKKESNSLEKGIENWNKIVLKQSTIDPSITYNQQLLQFFKLKYKSESVVTEQQQQKPIIESVINSKHFMITRLQAKLNEIGIFNPLYQIYDGNSVSKELKLKSIEDQILFDRMRQRVKWMLQNSNISIDQKQQELSCYYAYIKTLSQ